MFSSINRIKHGFTIVELMIVMGIFAILIGFTTINLLSAQNHASVSATIDTFMSDAHQQQLKAMAGDQTINSTSSAGIYFQATTYTLFQGTSYIANDTNNYVVTLPSVLRFSSINLPSSLVIFSPNSGEILNYSSNSNSVTITNTQTNEQKTITFNKYGIITNVN